MTPHFMIGMISVAIVVLGANTVCGQEFPGKPVHLVTSEAGGAGDFASRVIGQALTATLGQPAVIENRPSAAAEYVAKAPPDGHTLLHYGNIIWIAPLMRSVQWDPVKDFAPVMLTMTGPNLLVVTASLPVKSVKDLIALAKARPGELNYGSSASGSGTHLAAELFNAMAGVNIVRINYKGVSTAITDVASGRVQLMFLGAGAVKPYISSGKLRALAVASLQPSALFPGMSTVAASGVPGYEYSAQFGMFAPVKISASVVARINQEVARLLNKPDVKEKLFNAGMEVVGSSPEQFGATIKSDMAKWGKVIRDAGIRAE